MLIFPRSCHEGV